MAHLLIQILMIQMESSKLKYERQYKELVEEYDYLEYENKKLKKKMGLSAVSEDIIDLDEDDEEN